VSGVIISAMLCTYCDFTTKCKLELLEHIERVHGISPFTCKHCKVAHFTTEAKLRVHEKKNCFVLKRVLQKKLEELKNVEPPKKGVKTKRTYRKFPEEEKNAQTNTAKSKIDNSAKKAKLSLKNTSTKQSSENVVSKQLSQMQSCRGGGKPLSYMLQKQRDEFASTSTGGFTKQGAVSDSEIDDDDDVTAIFSTPTHQNTSITPEDRCTEESGVESEIFSTDNEQPPPILPSKANEVEYMQVTRPSCEKPKYFTVKREVDDVLEISDSKDLLFCQHCNFQTSRNDILNEHLKTMHAQCNICNVSLASKHALPKHIKDLHAPLVAPCNQCNVQFNRNVDRAAHMLEHSGGRIIREGLNANLRHVQIASNTSMDNSDLLIFFDTYRENIRQIIDSENSRVGGIKYNIVLEISMRKPTSSGEEIETHPVFKSSSQICLSVEGDFLDTISIAEQEILGRVERFTCEGSGWHLCKIKLATVEMAKYSPLMGHAFMNLPNKIHNKHACINIKIDDGYCFIYCIVAHFTYHLHKGHANECEVYRKYLNLSDKTALVPIENKNLLINFDGLNHPMSIKDIAKFECKNRQISINVYTVDENEGIVPLRVSKNVSERQYHVNLLFISNNLTSHYVLIKSLSRLLNSKDSKQRFYCDMCLQHVYSKEALSEHIFDCKNFKTQKVTMPAVGEKLQFTAVQKTQYLPWVIYGDIECTLEPLPNIQKGEKTFLTHKHVPNSFAMYTIPQEDIGETPSFECEYGKDDIMNVFMQRLKLRSEQIQKWRINHEAKSLVEVDFDTMSQSNCCLCKKPLTPTDVIHRHHSHFTSESIGYAHRSCNLNAIVKNETPVVLHNAYGYDIAAFIRSLAKHVGGNINVIAESGEKYKSISWRFQCAVCKQMDITCNHHGTMRLVDSLHFLNSSLSKLIETYKSTGEFKHLKAWCEKNLAEDEIAQGFEMLQRKNIFPYEYITSFDVLVNTKKLPDIEHFYSSLTESGVSQCEYDFACEVFSFFKCENLLSYMILYLKMDVILLADVFEIFRKTCFERVGLDVLQYYGMPGFAWDNMLKTTGVQLDLLSDINIFNYFENSIRGGMATVGSIRHAKANNKYMQNYNKHEPISYIHDYDANNLYGVGLCYLLPHSEFTWMTRDELNLLFEQIDNGNLECLDLTENPRGFTLEVDLIYPQKLHDSHNCLPLAVENIIPKVEWFSKEQKSFNMPPPKHKKLIGHFYPRYRYKVHWYALKVYLDLGLKLVCIHRGVSYNHSRWLYDWIVTNAKMRAESNSPIIKRLHKDLNNFIYGKSVQKSRGLLDMKLVTKWGSFKKLSTKPTYMSHTIYDENLIGVQLEQANVLLNKVTYVGSTCLDYAKAHMALFWYRCIKQVMPLSRLILHDTDSVIFQSSHEDYFERLKLIIKEMDLYTYDPNHEVFDDKTLKYRIENYMVLGKFKDELAPDMIVEAIAIRAKMYSLLTEMLYNVKRSKGVPKMSLEHQVNHDDYKFCLLTRQSINAVSSTIQNLKHELYTVNSTRTAINCFDDKRYICDGGKETLAYGHYACNNEDILEKCVEMADILEK